MKMIRTKQAIRAGVKIPGSKSITHRGLIAAALAAGESRLQGYLQCEDTMYTADCLRSLGFGIEMDGNRAEIRGKGGMFSKNNLRQTLFVGNSGTSLRLLLPVSALAPGEQVLTGAPRMLARPVGDLVEALNKLGAKPSFLGNRGYPPVLVPAVPMRGGQVIVPGQQSSQFLSSLLLCSPYAARDVQIEISGDLVSRPYVDITLEVMQKFGVAVEREGYGYFKISAGQVYQPRQLTVEGDASNASYFWAAAAVTGGTVRTENIFAGATRQGDINLLGIFEEMGCEVERGDNHVTVQGGSLSGIELDMSAMPDMVPTLAAVALFASGRTGIRNVSHLSLKESNRLQALASEYRKLGADIEASADGIIITGGNKLSGAILETHDDHRLAMAHAVAGLRVAGIKVRNEHCVKKSFPNFWELWDRL